MRTRTAAVATLVTSALLSLLVPAAAHADTAKGDTVFTSVNFNQKTFNIGVSAAQTVSVAATAKDGSGINGILGAKLVSSDDRIIHARSADCARPSSTTMRCVFKFTLDADRTDYYDLRNSSAGIWRFTAEAVAKDQDFYDLETSAKIQVKRLAKLATTQAGPEPVAKGGRLTVTGALTRADWNTNTYVPHAGRSVALQFKRSGTSTYSTVKTVTTDAGGKLRTTVTATTSGTWRWKATATSTTSGATAYGDTVTAK
ncbi:calcium-binding protein [Streptomyces deccanensis]|uniref:calcium-binding protein n=1 Tax=Streptomyces deccanensis TaxID=424188 RepID=UPI001EFB9373|nr:calcium-binding protein [Streptomyces deccanensis]ULR51701.1 calcium-binding protein [Streptomyces deccanensis]